MSPGVTAMKPICELGFHAAFAYLSIWFIKAYLYEKELRALLSRHDAGPITLRS